MSIHKTWFRFLVLVGVVVFLLSAGLYYGFYLNSQRMERERAEGLRTFVIEQKTQFLKDMVRYAVAEVEIRRREAEERAMDEQAVYDAVVKDMQRYVAARVSHGRRLTIYQRNPNDNLQELTETGCSLSQREEVTQDGAETTRLVYSELYRQYDWVISAEMSLDDIDALVDSHGEQFHSQWGDILRVMLMEFAMLTGLAVFALALAGKAVYAQTDRSLRRSGGWLLRTR